MTTDRALGLVPFLQNGLFPPAVVSVNHLLRIQPPAASSWLADARVVYVAPVMASRP